MAEEKRGRGRPATGVTPMRKLRAGAIWDEAAELAAGRGETMTAFVLRALRREVALSRGEEPEPE